MARVTRYMIVPRWEEGAVKVYTPSGAWAWAVPIIEAEFKEVA